MQNIIFASTSQYKQKQLKQLGIFFQAIDPQIDEDHARNMPADELALTLSRDKALALGHQYPNAIIIGSDQTAEDSHGVLLTKPGTRQQAKSQLMLSSQQVIRFHSAVTVVSPDQTLQAITTTTVKFKALSESEIERYLDYDQPYDCVGSFKAESLGISLFEYIESRDPTALIGLPLIATAKLLRSTDITLP